MNPVRTVLCMPIVRDASYQVLSSLLNLYARGTAEGQFTAQFLQPNALVDQARNLLVTYAMDVPTDPTHILWIDSDMVVPSDALSRLAAHDVPVVGGLYFERFKPHGPIAYDWAEDRGKQIAIEPGASGLREVGVLGFGCTLVRMDVYTEMAERYPPPFWHATDGQSGEDFAFFRKCREMGIPVYLDQDLKCGHVNAEIVTQDHYNAMRVIAERKQQCQSP